MPMKSVKQRRALHAKAARGEVSERIVAEMEAATPKGKKLPLYAPKKKRAKKRAKKKAAVGFN